MTFQLNFHVGIEYRNTPTSSVLSWSTYLPPFGVLHLICNANYYCASTMEINNSTFYYDYVHREIMNIFI
jgi:hypothetical protein